MKTPITERLTDGDAMEIRRRYASGTVPYADLADEYDVSSSTISRIVNGKLFDHLPTIDGGPYTPQAKLSHAEVREIRVRYAKGGISYAGLADRYPVCRQVIGDIVRGDRWQNVGGPRTVPGGPESDAHNRATGAVVNVTSTWPDPQPGWYTSEGGDSQERRFNTPRNASASTKTERAEEHQ